MTGEASQVIAQSDEPRRMLTLVQVLDIVPVGRTTLFKMESKGTFPRSRYASANRRFWFADEVAQWQRDLPKNSKIGRKAVQARSGSK